MAHRLRKHLQRYLFIEFFELFKHERIFFYKRRCEFFDERPIFTENVLSFLITAGKHGTAFSNDFIIVWFRRQRIMIIWMEQRKTAHRIIGDEPLHDGGSAVDI